jgi:hypothetical protein
MPDLERTASRGESSSLLSGHHYEKEIAMRPLADQASDAASLVSEDSYDSAQAGVKRLEAISSTWSKTGLYVAYLGYVSSQCTCQSNMLMSI